MKITAVFAELETLLQLAKRQGRVIIKTELTYKRFT